MEDRPMHGAEVRRLARDLIADGYSIRATGSQLGVSRAAIREWMMQPQVAPPRCPAPPLSSPEYSALFGFYLGDGCISRNSRTFSLRISCDAAYPNIVAEVEQLIVHIHPERRTYLVRAPGVTVVQSYWNHWPCLFPQHGPGRKHERELGMTAWQWAIVQNEPAEFLRGLFHSDGCRTNNWATRMVRGEKRRYDYPRWQFTNASEEILGWCGDALDLLGLAWRRSGPRTISVSRGADVARLDGLIGLKS